MKESRSGICLAHFRKSCQEMKTNQIITIEFKKIKGGDKNNRQLGGENRLITKRLNLS